MQRYGLDGWISPIHFIVRPLSGLYKELLCTASVLGECPNS
jgi:hypothetical protein